MERAVKIDLQLPFYDYAELLAHMAIKAMRPATRLNGSVKWVHPLVLRVHHEGLDFRVPSIQRESDPLVLLKDHGIIILTLHEKVCNLTL